MIFLQQFKLFKIIISEIVIFECQFSKYATKWNYGTSGNYGNSTCKKE